jgi:pimeloyl-ACP methyl ester carboxylesterase
MPTVLAGLTASDVRTPRLAAHVVERAGAGEAPPVVLVHGNVSSSLFFQPLMLGLPDGIRALAVDLRGFGDSETLPVDATRGLRDYSDDVAAVLDTLGTGPVHLVGWSMGGGVVLQLLLDRPDLVASVTLESPVSPYGFGGTTADGTMLNGGAGTGGGGANPEFVAALQHGDRTDANPTSPRTVYRTTYVKHPERVPNEDLWVESMLTTAIGEDHYPGDATVVDAWPGFGPGSRGVLNTMTPDHLDLTGIVDAPTKPPILWVRGADDVIVSDGSFFDLNLLGSIGAVPGWPGADVAPPQPMVGQTRAVLERYRAAGGAVTEVVVPDCGHSPHLEAPATFTAALVAHIGAA